jgi:hypothetical protein
MIIICSWCKEILGEKESLDDRRITHGMCSLCTEKITAEFKEYQNQFGLRPCCPQSQGKPWTEGKIPGGRILSDPNAIGETLAQREGDQGTAVEGHGGAAQTMPMTDLGANPGRRNSLC